MCIYDTETDKFSAQTIFRNPSSRYFKNGIANSTWTIVEGSGTGDLSDIDGKVSFSEGHKEEYSVTLEFMLD